MNYYNEYDPKAAAWLRELIAENLIPKGEVDERSIADIQPNDLRGFIQCHFFAGIGGWPYALQLAGWPEDEPVWTGSCPCQPFSAAGKQRGTADERHLWPEFFRLIRERRPSTVFGEQVASKLGREWLAGVFADLEGVGYAVTGADLCAASTGAPHIRQRLFWVANAEHSERRPQYIDREHVINGSDQGRPEAHGQSGARSEVCGLGDHQSNGCWSRYSTIPCLDGKSRRVESGTFPLAHGVPGRVGLLRGYGNAIVPACAATFIRAFMDVSK